MVGLELQGEPPPSEAFAYWRAIFLSGDVGFAIMFVLEPLLRLLVLRSLVCRVWLNYIDMIAGVSCAIEVVWFFQKTSSGYQEALFLLRILRIGKLFRALKLLGLASSLSPLQLLVKCLQASRGMLFWTFCLLSLLQAVAAIVLNIFAVQYCNDRSQSLATREEVFLYYGTFTRSFLTMFEVMFANWGPACRVVVEDISEWFAIFFLLYRNVVNSVFVQQTMKTASSDEDLAFKQKEKDKALYNRKVKKLFQNIDVSGDGSINLEEPATRCVLSPFKVRAELCKDTFAREATELQGVKWFRV
ncbi:CACNA1H [Symbiodinium natans]|uniref:CACNA1H protein n=1 Tax=Symbiodinium natans TaxID=878477 RepID=A0A812UQN8_9DINO|nr:CACNA1H [Symbiodinium natans]